MKLMNNTTWKKIQLTVWLSLVKRKTKNEDSQIDTYVCSFIISQYIPIQPSTQQMFIYIYSTTCFDPNWPSSGSARLTHSITELQHA
jgi:hypothetical protein